MQEVNSRLINPRRGAQIYQIVFQFILSKLMWQELLKVKKLLIRIRVILLAV